MTYSNNLFSFFFIDNIIMNIDDIPIAPTGAVRSRKEIRDEILKECEKTYLVKNGWGDYADWKIDAAIKIGKNKVTKDLVNCVTLHPKYGGKSRRRKSKKKTKRKTKRKTKKGKNSRKLRTSKKHV